MSDDHDEGYTVAALAARIAENRALSEIVRAGHAEARSRSSRYLTCSVVLVVEAIRAVGAAETGEIAALGDALLQYGITIPRGGEVTNALARAIMGPDIDKARIHRVASAAREIIERRINDPAAFMMDKGEGVTALAAAWSARNAPPSRTEKREPPRASSRLTSPLTISDSFQRWLADRGGGSIIVHADKAGCIRPIGAVAPHGTSGDFMLCQHRPAPDRPGLPLASGQTSEVEGTIILTRVDRKTLGLILCGEFKKAGISIDDPPVDGGMPS